MKFTPDFGRYFVIINDVKIPVPAGIEYVTINMNDVVCGWSARPFISEGYWDCLVCPGYRLGDIEWDDDDVGKYQIYEVQS